MSRLPLVCQRFLFQYRTTMNLHRSLGWVYKVLENGLVCCPILSSQWIVYPPKDFEKPAATIEALPSDIRYHCEISTHPSVSPSHQRLAQISADERASPKCASTLSSMHPARGTKTPTGSSRSFAGKQDIRRAKLRRCSTFTCAQRRV